MAQLQKNYLWIPSVYLMQGLPFALVAGVSPVLYKEFNFSNSQIAFYTSLFTLPWVLKFFFSPALEHLTAKKNILIWMQCLITLFIFLLAITLYFPNYIYITGIFFILIAFASAIHDISVDGLYLDCLDLHTQAKFIGIRTVFYQAGKLICQGGLLYLIGLFVLNYAKETVWLLALIGLSLSIFILMIYNYFVVPYKPLLLEKHHTILSSYINVLKEMKQLPYLYAATFFILFYHFPEAQLIKILPLYMLDQLQLGGLGLTVSQVGIIYGIISVISMLVGISLSGFLLTRLSLKTCLVPFTMLTVLGNSGYLILQIYTSHLLWQISLCVIIAQFTFGLSNGAYMFYLIRAFNKGNYAMSLYAIGTAIMLLGIMLAGSIAGYIQSILGYTGFFIWIILISIVMVFVAFYNAEKVL